MVVERPIESSVVLEVGPSIKERVFGELCCGSTWFYIGMPSVHEWLVAEWIAGCSSEQGSKRQVLLEWTPLSNHGLFSVRKSS